ncbi:MAG: hypothetical protein WA484_11950 [Solirubrobacteraceae bacterium]
MTAYEDNFDRAQPVRRMALPTCRRSGCDEPATSPEGFCIRCKRAYQAVRVVHEERLRQTARVLALANPQWRDTFAHAQPGQYELMLTHAAAHHLQRHEPAGDAMSLQALHDYLDETMDQVRKATDKRSA